MSWNSVPRSAAPGIAQQRVERHQRQDAPRIDRIGVAPQRLDLGHREMRRPMLERRLRLGPRREFDCGGRHRGRAPRRAARRRGRAWPGGLLGRRRSSSRCSQRDAHGRRVARARRAGQDDPLRAPSPSRNHARPGRSAAPAARGRVRVFISRDMKRSASRPRGQLPSLSPPTTSVSTLCSRASSAPQMAMRPSAAGAGLTISGRDQRGHNVRPFVGPERESRRSRRSAPRKKLGQLFAGVACIELGRGCPSRRGPALRAPRRSPARSRRSARADCSRQAASGASAAPRRRKHVAAPSASPLVADPGQPERLAAGSCRTRHGGCRKVARASAMSGRPVPPRSATSSIVSAAWRTSARSSPSGSSGCFSRAEHRHRIARPEHRFEQQRAGTRPAACRASGVPPESSARTPKRSELGRDAPRQVAVAGDQRRRRRRLRRSRSRKRDGDRHRLVALARRFDQRHAGTARRRMSAGAKRGAAARPVVGGFGRPQALPTGSSRARSASGPSERADLLDIAAQDADLAEQLRQAVLRMAEHRRAWRRLVDHRPGPLVERLVEAGQHDGAVGQAGDRRQQFGGGGDGAGRTRRDHRTRRAAFAAAVAASRRISALRCAAGLDRPRSARNSGQCSVTIARKSSVTCHQPARLPGTSSRKPRPVRRLRSRSRPSARRGRAPARSASAAEAGTTISSSNSAATCAGSRLFQARTSGASCSRRSSARDRRRKIDRSRAPPARTPPRPRRTRRAAGSPAGSPSRRAELLDEDRAQLARGAPRRHVDGDVGQRQRIAVVGGNPGTSVPTAAPRQASAGTPLRPEWRRRAGRGRRS